MGMDDIIKKLELEFNEKYQFVVNKNKNKVYDVLVFCTTYNHEKFIENAICGFVNQKVNFKYHIFVHDDASTDKTQSILRKFEKKYSDLFTVIYGVTNGVGNNINYYRDYLLKLVNVFNTKYIAMCEGDDYWIDNNKLQTQFDIMIKNPEYNMCVHNSHIIDPDNYLLQGRMKLINKNTVFCTNNLIMGHSRYFQTSSFFCKKYVICEVPKIITTDNGILDSSFVTNATLNNGKIFFINRFMSNYRSGYQHGHKIYNDAYFKDDSVIKRNLQALNAIKWRFKNDRQNEIAFSKFFMKAYHGKICWSLFKLTKKINYLCPENFYYLIQFMLDLPTKILYFCYRFVNRKINLINNYKLKSV